MSPHGERSALHSNAKQDGEYDQQRDTGATAPICGNGLGERAAGCARAAGAPAAAALPCQNSNNSNKRGYKLVPISGAPGLFTDRQKHHVWDLQEDDADTLHRIGPPTGAEARLAFQLRLNVAAFVSHWGRNHCLFFTVTDEANLHPTQFARRWNSFLVRNGGWIRSFIRVLEPQKQGRPHYHLLVAVPWDTRPDAFDWAAFDGAQAERKTNGPTVLFRELRARYKASAAPELVALWARLRKVLPRYGLGRSELLPVRKGEAAIAAYVGKYLEGGLVIKKHSWKGCRRVEYDRRAKVDWIARSRGFAWDSPGAVLWRSRVGEVGAVLGGQDTDGIKRKVGPKWAYRLRDTITSASEEDWSLVLRSLAPR